MNKFYIFLLPALLLAGVLNAQRVTFGYDAAGNRVSRTITMSGGTVTTDLHQVFVEVLGERQVNIYPNPTKGMLAVEITGGDIDNDIRLTLYDLNGKQLQTLQLSTGINTPVDMLAYPPAVYILRLYMDGKTTEYKIIKQ